MLRDSKEMPLTRRLVDYYLMFALAGIASLFYGILLVLWSTAVDKDESSLLPAVREITSRITSEYAENSEADVQSLLNQYRTDYELNFCAVIGRDGNYIAHSDSSRIGKNSPIASPAEMRENEINQILPLEQGEGNVLEYRSLLQDGDRQFGILQVSAFQQPPESWFSMVADYVPFTIVVPALILAAGVHVMRRSAASARDIETQLRHLSLEPTEEWRLHTVPQAGAESIGWNRVVGRVKNHQSIDNLEERISRALGGLQARNAERVLKTLPDGVALSDKNMRISFANNALTALLQVESENELIGNSIDEVLSLDNSPNGEEVRRLLHSQSSFCVVAELNRSEVPSEGVLRIARSTVHDQDEGDSAYVWTVRDITQQKLSEEMRSQFVSSATHELRTPLTNIKAYAETLAIDNSINVEKQKEFCNIINTEATRLSRFVDDLLDINRMEAGSLTLEKHETDLMRLLEEVIEKVRPQIEQKQLEFNSVIPPKLPKLQIDKDKVSAALVNLLGNAAKYTPEGGAVAMHVESTVNEIRIDVEDTGIGISEEELPKVFNKFFRSSDERIHEITGSGLGLSFAQEVARLHKGRIEIHSELDKGSRFTLILPVS